MEQPHVVGAQVPGPLGLDDGGPRRFPAEGLHAPPDPRGRLRRPQRREDGFRPGLRRDNSITGLPDYMAPFGEVASRTTFVLIQNPDPKEK